MSIAKRLGLALTIVLATQVATPAAVIVDFDGGGNTAFTFTNTSGDPAAVANGGATGNFARLTNLTGSNNNSIAFDENPSASGPAPAGIRMAFDFRMTGDQANADAGGCCGSAADGLGIGLYSTATYGATGASNPADGGSAWERPAHADAFAVGLDVFQNIDVVSLNWAGAEVATADVQPFLDLNNGVLNRAIVDIKPNGGDALVDMTVLEDIHGNTTAHSVFSGEAVAGLDLNSLPNYRLIAGGRTGGAFVAGDIDNIFVAAVPEPGSIALLAIGGLMLTGLRRRRR